MSKKVVSIVKPLRGAVAAVVNQSESDGRSYREKLLDPTRGDLLGQLLNKVKIEDSEASRDAARSFLQTIGASTKQQIERRILLAPSLKLFQTTLNAESYINRLQRCGTVKLALGFVVANGDDMTQSEILEAFKHCKTLKPTVAHFTKVVHWYSNVTLLGADSAPLLSQLSDCVCEIACGIVKGSIVIDNLLENEGISHLKEAQPLLKELRKFGIKASQIMSDQEKNLDAVDNGKKEDKKKKKKGKRGQDAAPAGTDLVADSANPATSNACGDIVEAGSVNQPENAAKAKRVSKASALVRDPYYVLAMKIQEKASLVDQESEKKGNGAAKECSKKDPEQQPPTTKKKKGKKSKKDKKTKMTGTKKDKTAPEANETERPPQKLAGQGEEDEDMEPKPKRAKIEPEEDAIANASVPPGDQSVAKVTPKTRPKVSFQTPGSTKRTSPTASDWYLKLVSTGRAARIAKKAEKDKQMAATKAKAEAAADLMEEIRLESEIRSGNVNGDLEIDENVTLSDARLDEKKGPSPAGSACIRLRASRPQGQAQAFIDRQHIAVSDVLNMGESESDGDVDGGGSVLFGENYVIDAESDHSSDEIDASEAGEPVGAGRGNDIPTDTNNTTNTSGTDNKNNSNNNRECDIGKSGRDGVENPTAGGNDDKKDEKNTGAAKIPQPVMASTVNPDQTYDEQTKKPKRKPGRDMLLMLSCRELLMKESRLFTSKMGYSRLAEAIAVADDVAHVLSSFSYADICVACFHFGLERGVDSLRRFVHNSYANPISTTSKSLPLLQNLLEMFDSVAGTDEWQLTFLKEQYGSSAALKPILGTIKKAAQTEVDVFDSFVEKSSADKTLQTWILLPNLDADLYAPKYVQSTQALLSMMQKVGVDEFSYDRSEIKDAYETAMKAIETAIMKNSVDKIFENWLGRVMEKELDKLLKSESPSEVRELQSEGKLSFLKDFNFSSAGKSMILRIVRHMDNLENKAKKDRFDTKKKEEKADRGVKMEGGVEAITWDAGDSDGDENSDDNDFNERGEGDAASDGGGEETEDDLLADDNEEEKCSGSEDGESDDDDEEEGSEEESEDAADDSEEKSD